jgi:putrescine transport system permease protein
LNKLTKVAITLPFIWILLFLILPIILTLKVSLSDIVYGIPPYQNMFELIHGEYLQIKLHISNYMLILTDSFYAYTYMNSVWMSLKATALALVFGYPFAYAISRTSSSMQMILVILVIMPFWTSFLIRIYALISILSPNGIVNSIMMKLGIINSPLSLIGNDFSVCLGLVYCYFPFMVLPIYFSLSKMDKTLLEAAYDLGCRPMKAFINVTLPLSIRGIKTGCMLIFVPSLGEFVIPELLGSSETLMIGRVLWNEFMSNRDWPVACALAIIMLCIIFLPMILIQRESKK